MKLKTYTKSIVFTGDSGLEMPIREGITALKIRTNDREEDAYIGIVEKLNDDSLILSNSGIKKTIPFKDINEVFYSDILS